MSIYFPYFRGKQYELLTVKENAQLLADAVFTPIIEPVKKPFNGLQRTLDAISQANASAIVVVNPMFGEHSQTPQLISDFLDENFAEYQDIYPGIILTEDTRVDEVKIIVDKFKDKNIGFIHLGFTDARNLSEQFESENLRFKQFFHDSHCGKLYQKHFKKSKSRILLRDGFEKRTNRKHPDVEFFSDLHATYELEGMHGFGDFLMVGNDYSESGGPAYSVAIHLTFIDHEKDDEMHIHHFKSIRQDDPTDPAGKFAEALEKMMLEVNRPDTKILYTAAVKEFSELHERGHFPGLGYVKKLSMKHHLETLAHYFDNI